jgi:hypothetical protein
MSMTPSQQRHPMEDRSPHQDVRGRMQIVPKSDEEPVPDWVTDRETDEGVPTTGMPEPVQEPSDLYLESQPWARYAGAGGLERMAAMTIHRQRLRSQGYAVPRVPWLAIAVGSLLAVLMVGGLFLLAQWVARWI